MFAKYLNKYLFYLVNGTAPKLLRTALANQGWWNLLYFLQRTVNCEVWSVCVFNMENSCSHTYADSKTDRTPNAYFFIFTQVWGWHVLNMSLYDVGRFSISHHLWFWAAFWISSETAFFSLPFRIFFSKDCVFIFEMSCHIWSLIVGQFLTTC